MLTGVDDRTVADQAVRKGAQDYLVKGQFGAELLLRAMRYAIERHRLLRQLAETRQRENELRLLEVNGATPGTSMTAGMFGQLPLSQSRSGIFGELVERYGDLIDLALEQRVFKVENDLSGQLRSLG